MKTTYMNEDEAMVKFFQEMPHEERDALFDRNGVLSDEQRRRVHELTGRLPSPGSYLMVRRSDVDALIAQRRHDARKHP
jgi:hypothetical protein